MTHAELLKPMMADVSRELNEAHIHGDNLLFEGAQGTLLDVDHGTYPYVTSSNCVAGNAAAGAGVGPGMLHYILGITKAYCTRVGGGPFPTELDWATPGTVGYHLSTVGAEKGVTTGRSRRCGWFDAALLKRSAQVNGLSGLCITKLDVLDGIDELQLCTGYELDGEHIDILPLGADEISRCKPVYETMEGWTRKHRGRDAIRQAACQCAFVPAAHRARDRRADRYDLDQPRPRPHDHDAAPLPGLRRTSRMLTEDGKHLYVSYDEYHSLIEKLAIKVHQSGWEFDTILCLARGGMRPGDILSRIFDKPLAIMSTSSYRAEAGTIQGHLDIARYITTPKGEIAGKVLLVDDLADSGHTLHRGGGPAAHQLCADHGAAHRGDLGQGPVHLHAGLLGGVPAHEPVDPPAVRDLRQHGPRKAAGEVEDLKAARVSPRRRRAAACSTRRTGAGTAPA